MRPELLVPIISILAFIAVIFGAVNLIFVKRFENQKEEAERIFRRRMFNSNEETKGELSKFFRKAKRPVSLSALGFASAFILFTVVAKRLWPSDSVPRTILSLGILLIIFGPSLAMLVLADKNITSLKKDIMERFKTK